MDIDTRTNKEEITYTVSRGGVITLYIKDKVYCVADDHPSHRLLINKLKDKDYVDLEALVCPSHIFEYAFDAKIIDEEVFVNGKPLHNTLTKRTLELSRKGYDVKFLLSFLANCEKNPSNRAIMELYDFLENRNLPITEDGCFLAYKRVREDWFDIYSGTIKNEIGSTVSMPRLNVDDDRNHQCSYGLHVGALEYVKNYGSGGHILIVKVNPKDCISLPLDHGAQKLRVCQYEILYELVEHEALPFPVYSSSGEKVNSVDTWRSDNETTDEEEAADEYWTEGWKK